MSSKPRNQSRPKSRTARLGEHQKVVGAYMLGKTVGEGTFGKVKLAVHIPTGEKVAVKILEKSRIKDQADVRRVNREIKILKKAKNPNIIQLYEVIDTSSVIYLIMENADGGELFDYIVQHRHVQEIQACKFFHQLISGIEALHLYEITHRDLKPENLLLKHSPDGFVVKIVDFGLSNTHEGGRFLSTACGSPCYAAPEMIAGHKYFGPLADIWSLGVILFALVCGYLPFEDPNTSALYKKILSGDYKPARWISSDVRDLIRKILVVDPKKRYTIEQIKRHPWYGMVNEAAVPKDLAHESSSNAEFRKETLLSVDQAGFDPQAVNDAVSSNCCNSLSALYYLFEQKLYAAKIKSDLRPQATIAEQPLSASMTTGISANVPAIVTGIGSSEQGPPPMVPILQPLNPPPQRLRPVAPPPPIEKKPEGPDVNSTQSGEETAAAAAVMCPRAVPPISAAKPSVPRGVVDRQNWRLRGYRANVEVASNSPADPLSIISTKAVLQNKENGSPSPTSMSPRNQPIASKPPSGMDSPRKQQPVNKIVPDVGISLALPIQNVPVLKLSDNTISEKVNTDDNIEIVANPPPDEFETSAERPSTRRSHLRTPGRSTRPNTAEYGEFGEATAHGDEMAFTEQPSIPESAVDHVHTTSNEVPPSVINADQQAEAAIIEIRAPEAPKSSQHAGSVGGRRGRHLKSAPDGDRDKDDGIRGPDIVSNPASISTNKTENGKKSINVVTALGARLLAPLGSSKLDSSQVSARDAAVKNKASQGGSLISSAAGIVASSAQ